ncbi:2-isopropylmalate synthase [Nannocystis sp. ILAH1]|uniref:LeuA family protein n=1 Tax=unclassified Nannocystis TaxID=2627009 RepID=UPI00226EAB7B|nr:MULTISPECIES: 2-isopropylmalate synthase [unclassified Nannocystis]MCY0987492.1 2-isopropylmalate synthase [Nannocystis sp. ILAH1]MCY1070713.1 2-isopropylmalate synthase [Nannocystis sp. RBIL2]
MATTHANTAALIYDWNEKERTAPLLRRAPRFVDESIRDGIQSPSVRDPSIEQKMELVRLMDRMGVQAVNLGLPGAGRRAQEDVERLLRFIVEEKLRITANCAARTVASDIHPIIDISQKVGVPIEVMTFIGSSPIRGYTEGWDNERLKKHTHEAVKLGVDHGLPVGFVTEDTTRSHPKTLDVLFRTALEAGAGRLVLCDTCGHATPDGLRNLLNFARGVLRSMDLEDTVELDWHGHNDRGMALVLGLYAFEWGFHRVHGCGLGIGERVGNCSLDLLLLNLYLLGQLDPAQHDLSCLVEYVEKISEATGVPIHPSYPLSGRDAFRTATGVHAAAIIKATKTGDHDLADRVYSSVPARVFGRKQEIEIGHYSGRSNVIFWLREHGYEPSDELVDRVFNFAKSQNHTLTTEEVKAVIAGG